MLNNRSIGVSVNLIAADFMDIYSISQFHVKFMIN